MTDTLGLGILASMTARYHIAALTIAAATSMANAGPASAQSSGPMPLSPERVAAIAECDAMTDRIEVNSRRMAKEEFLDFMKRKSETCAVAHPGVAAEPSSSVWPGYAAMAALPVLAVGLLAWTRRGTRRAKLRR